MPATATKKAAKKTLAKKAAAKKQATVSTDVLINLVLDQSGSMSGLNSATCEGINSFFDEQRKQPGRALLSMTLFDTEFDVRFVATDLTEVADLGTEENPYSPRGMTALYDAVATTVHGTQAWLSKHKDFDGKVICVIQTDGGENSSRNTSLDQLNDLISEKTKQGWEFLFMGAGAAAWTEGEKFTSIPQDSRLAYAASAGATVGSYNAVSTSLSNTRSTGIAFASNVASNVKQEDAADKS